MCFMAQTAPSCPQGFPWSEIKVSERWRNRESLPGLKVYKNIRLQQWLESFALQTGVNFSLLSFWQVWNHSGVALHFISTVCTICELCVCTDVISLQSAYPEWNQPLSTQKVKNNWSLHRNRTQFKTFSQQALVSVEVTTNISPWMPMWRLSITYN